MENQNEAPLGETVLFVLPNKEVTSAIVTRSKPGNRCDLTVFNNTDTGEFRNGSIHQNVSYSEDATAPGTWHSKPQSGQHQRQAARA